jgi:hypothetical protein
MEFIVSVLAIFGLFTIICFIVCVLANKEPTDYYDYSKVAVEAVNADNRQIVLEEKCSCRTLLHTLYDYNHNFDYAPWQFQIQAEIEKRELYDTSKHNNLKETVCPLCVTKVKRQVRMKRQDNIDKGWYDIGEYSV